MCEVFVRLGYRDSTTTAKVHAQELKRDNFRELPVVMGVLKLF